tara:strand:+ start:383 stop:1492 length:1110 start_codon:yes stop_codon:yes gene_type:complete
MVEDPIKTMVTDAVYARYHDEEFAKKTLLSRFKNIYHPAPTSDIITLEFDWEQGIISEDIKTISNPLQLAPTIDYVSVKRETVSEELTEELTTLTGVWSNVMVGPLIGKPYSKEVPIKYITVGLDYYTFTPNSRFEFDSDSRFGLSKTFNGYYHIFKNLRSSYEKTAVLTATARQALQTQGLKNIPYYTTGYNYRKYDIQPVNWNPVVINLDYFFATLEWGEIIFEDPPRSLKEDESFYEGIISAQSEARELIKNWVDSNIDILFEYYEDEYDEDEHGWTFDANWKMELGKWILQEWELGSVWLFNLIDAALGWQFVHLDQWQKDYLTENRKKLEAFRNGPTLYFLSALTIPEDDYLEEWITDILNDEH